MKKNIHTGIIILNIVFALAALFYFYLNRYYFVGSDVYYYLSLADSLIKNGYLSNLTSSPPSQIVSPQNGIVFLMAGFKNLGLSNFQVITTIPIINFILYVISFYPIYRLAKSLKFSKARIYMLSLFYYSHWVAYRLQLISVNDGIYNAVIIWLFYLVYRQLTDRPKLLPLIILLSGLTIHFRINVYLFLLSVITSTIILKRFRQAAVYFLVLGLTFLSLKAVVNSPVYSSNVKQLGQASTYIKYYSKKIIVNTKNSNNEATIYQDVHELFLERIPELFLVRLDRISSSLNYLYLSLVIIQAYCLFKGIKTKNFILIFFSSFIFLSYFFAIFVGIPNHRYFFHSYILTILMIIFLSKQNFVLHSFSIAYLLLILTLSIYVFSGKRQTPCLPSLLYSLKEKGTTLPTNSVLFSELDRHPYLFLNQPTQNIHKLPNDILKRSVYLVAGQKFNDLTISNLSVLVDTGITSTPVTQLKDLDQSCGLFKLNFTNE